jgi:protease-4
MRFKAEHGVPLLVQMLDVAASGGYYVALAGDEIVATPTTTTGSIGVIFNNVSVAGLMDKLVVRDQTVASGAMKDIGSPLRTMTPAEREVLERLIGDFQARFVALVRERRPGLTPEMGATMVDGRVFSADQALQGGLIDRIGYLDDTIEGAKARAGVSEARVIRYRRTNEYDDGIYARADLPAQVTQVSLLNLDNRRLPAGPNFLYLWAP